MNFKEELMMAANIMPSSSLNISRGGKGEKAFYKYKKIQGKRIIKRPVPKFKDLLKTY